MRISDWSSDVCSSDLRQEALQLRVLRLQRPQPLCVRHRHAAEPGLVLVEGRIRDAVLAADLCGLHPGIVFADHPDDLLLRKSALSHGSSFLSMDSTISWPAFRGQIGIASGRERVSQYV